METFYTVMAGAACAEAARRMADREEIFIAGFLFQTGCRD